MHQQTRTLAHMASAMEPRSARSGSRGSGEGNPLRSTGEFKPAAPAARQTATAHLLRHNLTAPEKKTLKRIEALRQGLLNAGHDGVPVDRDSLGARIFDHLSVDRGLAGNIAADGYVVLAARLIDPAHLCVSAAALVGLYLREVGATERGVTTPERVKRALQILNDVLYDHDNGSAAIPSAVRELKLEKRDGGLQIAAYLRVGACEPLAIEALKLELARVGFADVVVRTATAPLPPVVKGHSASR